MMVFHTPRRNALFTVAAVLSLFVTSTQAQDACLNETVAVQTEGVVDAFEAAIQGTLDLTDPSTCSSGSGTVSCSYDFTAASADLESVCETAEGQYVVNGFTLTCNVKAPDGSTASVAYAFVNSPSCVGMSCDVDALKEETETAANSMADMLEQTESISDCTVEQASAAFPVLGATAFVVLLFSTMATWTSLF